MRSGATLANIAVKGVKLLAKRTVTRRVARGAATTYLPEAMNRSRHTSRYPSRTTTLLLGAALLAACVLDASPGRASCLRNADPVIGRLQELVGENATKALRETQTRIDALEHAPRSNLELNAALYAVQAQSYSALELDSDARNAALQGLRLAPNAKDPTHLDLLSAYAENVYDEAGINSAVEEIETARALQKPTRTCDRSMRVTPISASSALIC